MSVKKPITSKTLWFNILTTVGMVGASLLADESFRDMVGSHAIFLIVGVNIVNVWLRTQTTKPLGNPEVTEDKKLNPLEQALKDDNDAINNF